MTEPELHIESFGSFIELERVHYSVEDGNTIAFAFSQLDRYLRFLQIVKNRHDELEERVRALTDQVMATAKSHSHDDQPMTDSERAEYAQWRDQSERLILEMESFFHFAYVALIRAAQLVGWYFGPERGVSFGSHRNWTKLAREYCQVKKLVAPDQLFPILQRCLEEITEPRSHAVVHDFNPRAVYGTQISADGTTNRFTTHITPTDKDTQSKLLPVKDAYILLSDYVGCLAELIATNRHRGRLESR